MSIRDTCSVNRLKIVELIRIKLNNLGNAIKFLILLLGALLFSILVALPSQADLANPVRLATSNNLGWLDLTGSSDGRYLVTSDSSPRVWGEESGNIYTSSDYGVTWRSVDSAYNFVALSSSQSGQRMVAVSQSYLHVSKNYGTSWSIIDKVATHSGILFTGVGISGDGSTMFVTTASGKALRYLWNSSSNNWYSPTSSLLPNNAGGGPVAVSQNGSVAYVGTPNNGIMKWSSNSWSALSGTTTVGGNTRNWTDVTTNNGGDKIFAFSENSGNGSVTLVSTNTGSSFTNLTFAPVSQITPTAIGMNASGSAFALTGRDANDDQRMIISFNDGNTWVEAKKIPWALYNSIHITSDAKNFYAGDLFWPLLKYSVTPDAVSNISVSELKHNTLTLKWLPANASSDTNSVVTNYNVQASSDNGATWSAYNQNFLPVSIVGGNGYATASITGLSPLTTYKFKITPSSGYGTGVSAISSPVSTYGLPSAPTGLTRQGYSNDRQILFSWTPPADTGTSQITGYLAEISSDNGNTWSSIRVINNQYAVAYDLNVRVNYQFRIAASNAAGTGPTSAILSGYAYSRIGTVRNLASSLTSTSATLSWQAPLSDGGSDVQFYRVGYKKTTDSTWTTISAVFTDSYTVTGLSGLYSYDFRVAVANTIGYISEYQYIYNDQPPLPATQLSLTRNSSGFKSGANFMTQPRLSLLATNSTLVASDSRTVVTAVISSGATLHGNTSETATAGVVTFNNLAIRGTAGNSYVITYFSGNLISASETITLAAGTPSKIVFHQNSSGVRVAASFDTQPIFKILDADDNVVAWDDTTTITMTASEGYLWNGISSTPTARAQQGIFTFSDVKWYGGAGYPFTLNYSTTGFSVPSETLTASHGVATTLTRTVRAQDAPLGNKFLTQPVYQVTDTSGNAISTFNGPITISASQGTLSGTKTIEAVNGVATFKDLSLTGLNAFQLVILTVTSPGFTPYTGDSIVTQKGRPILSWSSLFLSNGTPSFTVNEPDSSVSGTFSYSSGNTAVASFSGDTLSINGVGTATLTATFTPTDTSNYLSGETVTMTVTVIGGSNGITLSISGGTNTATYRTASTLTANVDNDGRVTFYAGGKKIPGCISKATMSGVATCSWRPAVRGAISIMASLNPESDQYPTVRSSVINVAVVNRSNRR